MTDIVEWLEKNAPLDSAARDYRLGEAANEIKDLRAKLLVSELNSNRYLWLRHGDNDEKVLEFSKESMATTDEVWLLRNEKLDARIDQYLNQTPPKLPVVVTTGHCPEKAKPGGCQLHNLQCGYPECDKKTASL